MCFDRFKLLLLNQSKTLTVKKNSLKHQFISSEINSEYLLVSYNLLVPDFFTKLQINHRINIDKKF